MDKTDRFYDASSLLPPFENVLRTVPARIAERACEIRLRSGRPVIVETPSERHICVGKTSSADELRACIKYFCDYSLYSAERELAEGRMTLKGGHRAGFTGTAVIKGGEVTAIKDISSINLRIAAEHKGIAEKLMSLTAFERDLNGLLILGPPLSAKTTLLRDYARLLSAFARTSVIDENGEIAAVYKGTAQNDLGMNCDVLDMFPKTEGIMRAVRFMSPEYLICDEVGGEYQQLAECAGKGVKLILSAHCGSMAEAARNRAVCALIDSGAVNYCALLGSGENIGKVKGLWRVDKSEDIGGCGSGNDLYGCRSRILVGA
ncbi:MAG: hypothetical protein J6O50_05395 [Ruminiclostridium sp.]|nr:hypothetical protein [Ruminiclostridium sp.]